MNLVSILMPVYNSEKYLSEAINSILCQTYKNFELLCIYDDSQDSSLEIIKKYELIDPRVKFLKNNFEKNIVGALNTGLNEAKGVYIARMDSDDISYPDRINLQVNFLDKNLDYVLCSTNAVIIDKNNNTIRKKMYLDLKNVSLEIRQIFENGIAHPTAIFRNSIIKSKNLKYQNVPAEDYHFWFILVKYGRIKRLPNILLKYRIHSNNSSQINNKNVQVSTKQCRENFLKETINCCQEEYNCFSSIANGELLINQNPNLTRNIIENFVKKCTKLWKLNASEIESTISYIYASNILKIYERKKLKIFFHTLFNSSFCIKIFITQLIFQFKIKFKLQ